MANVFSNWTFSLHFLLYKCCHYTFYLPHSLLGKEQPLLCSVFKSPNFLVCIPCSTNDTVIISIWKVLSYPSNFVPWFKYISLLYCSMTLYTYCFKCCTPYVFMNGRVIMLSNNGQHWTSSTNVPKNELLWDSRCAGLVKPHTIKWSCYILKMMNSVLINVVVMFALLAALTCCLNFRHT